MRRLFCVFVCLSAATGCLTPKDKASWNEAMKDAHGDNMRMQSGPGNTLDWDPAMRAKTRE